MANENFKIQSLQEIQNLKERNNELRNELDKTKNLLKMLEEERNVYKEKLENHLSDEPYKRVDELEKKFELVKQLMEILA